MMNRLRMPIWVCNRVVHCKGRGAVSRLTVNNRCLLRFNYRPILQGCPFAFLNGQVCSMVDITVLGNHISPGVDTT